MSVNTKPNKNYNWCIVPKCTNTSLKTPDKTFISVPKNKIRRKLWFNAVKRDWKLLSETSNVFVCEDHFDLEMDMENYVKWKLVGGNKLMKKTVVPHKFDCEVDRKRAFTNVPQSSAVKRARQQLIDEALAGQSTNHEGDYSGADVLFEKEEVVSETNSRDVGVNVQPQHTLRVLILHPRRMAKARKTLGPDETSHTITTDETLTKVLHFKDNSEAASIGEASQTVSAESSFARSEGPLKSLSINSDYVSSLDLEIKEECVEPDRLIDVGTPLTATSIQCDGIESSSNEQLKWNSHFVSCESGDDKTNGTATEDYPTPYTTHPNNTPNKTLHFGYNGENKTTSEDLKLHSPISNESLCAISESSKKRKLEDEKDEFDALGINFAAKLRKMSTTQQILAESLMHKVIKFGLLNKLTELTDIIEMDASPDRQLNTKVAVQPTSASASQSRIESITSELQIKVEQIDYSNDAELLNEY